MESKSSSESSFAVQHQTNCMAFKSAWFDSVSPLLSCSHTQLHTTGLNLRSHLFITNCYYVTERVERLNWIANWQMIKQWFVANFLLYVADWGQIIILLCDLWLPVGMKDSFQLAVKCSLNSLECLVHNFPLKTTRHILLHSCVRSFIPSLWKFHVLLE